MTMLQSEARVGARVRATANTFGISHMIPNDITGLAGIIVRVGGYTAVVVFDLPLRSSYDSTRPVHRLHVPLGALTLLDTIGLDDNVAV